MAEEEGVKKVSREEIYADQEEGLTGTTTGAEKVEETPTSDTTTSKVESAPAKEVEEGDEGEVGGKASIKDKVKGKIMQIGAKLTPKEEAEAENADPHKGLM